MLKVVRNVLIGAAGLYCLALCGLYVMQRDLVFSTSAQRVLPKDAGMHGVEEVTLRTTAGFKLYSWYGQALPQKPTILYLHGNGGSVSTRLDQYRQFMALGYGVFLLGYPGYGGSDGSPSEQAFVESAGLAYAFLRKAGIDADDIVLFGESLGSAVAIQLAAQMPAKALILSSPMSSIRAIAERQYPYVPMGLLLKDPFLSIDYIGSVRMPLVVFHGSADEAIPIASARVLFDAANEPKMFHTIDGGGHNNLFDYPLVERMHADLLAMTDSEEHDRD